MSVLVLKTGSKGNCYILKADKEWLIIEAGISFKEILAGINYELENVVGCLVTHEHKDHSKAVKDLLESGIDVYATQGTFNELKINHHRANILRVEKTIKIGNFTILAFDVVHDANEPVGFLIYHKKFGKVLFLTDAAYCDYNFKNVNSIFIECNYIKKKLKESDLCRSVKDRIILSHFELSDVISFLNNNNNENLKKVVLIHLSDKNSDAEIMKDTIQDEFKITVEIAKDRSEILL